MVYYTINTKQAAARGVTISGTMVYYDNYSIEIVNSSNEYFTVKPYWPKAFERDLERYGIDKYITTEEV